MTVLQAGNDRILLKTRCGVLESAGPQVVTAVGAGEALQRIPTATFDVAILCHSLTAAERAAVAAAVHRCNASTPVLLVESNQYAKGARPVGIDGLLDPHPRNLIQAVRSILGMPESDGAAAKLIPLARCSQRPH